VPDSSGPEPETAAVVVKKYANRRLYDTSTSAYVTLDDLSAMVKRGIDFVVQDARTGEDITRQVLTQIIVEEENRGDSLLPIQFLRQLIRFYGGGGPALLPSYLSMSLEAFARHQDRLRETFGAPPATHYFEDQVRQNMALFERSMRMFSPFAAGQTGEEVRPKAEEAAPAAAGDELDQLKQRVEEMSRQLERLTPRS
jgi:polyhydroxyalkanoate synthesis repressor PhaR